MRNWLALAAVAILALAIAGCSKKVPIRESGMADKGKMEHKMEGKMLDGKAIAKILKSGGVCKWKSASGEGEDFYFATDTPTMGDADRMMGKKTTSGKWAIKGDKLCLNFGGETCYTAHETGKKSFKGVPSEGAPVEFKC